MKYEVIVLLAIYDKADRENIVDKKWYVGNSDTICLWI